MSTAIRWAQLSFRLQRWEIVLLTAAVVFASGLMAWMALQLQSVANAHPDCVFAEAASSCLAAAQTFESMRDTGQLVMSSASLVTFGVGLFLGVPLVAREVEQRTAQLSWTIGRSRERWLIGRVAFAMLVGLVLLGMLAVMTDVLAATMRPEIDTSEAFWFYGVRGPLLIGRGLVALGTGVLIGAVIGKQLPALLLAALAVGAMTLASEVAFGAWHETEAVLAAENDHLSEPLGISSGIQLLSGERVGHGAAEFEDENGLLYESQDDFEARRNPIGRYYQLIIPGMRYGEIVARETAVLAAAALLLIGGAAAVTRRRRPS